MAPPLGLAAYRLATTALAPAVPFFLRQRALRGKEDTLRMRERLGYASVERPEGRLIWIHGASVGESVAALPLIEAFLKSGNNALVTSGTVTSAKLMAERLPTGAIHQYAPVDTPAAAKEPGVIMDASFDNNGDPTSATMAFYQYKGTEWTFVKQFAAGN